VGDQLSRSQNDWFTARPGPGEREWAREGELEKTWEKQHEGKEGRWKSSWIKMHSVLQTNREYLQAGERESLSPEALSAAAEGERAVEGEGGEEVRLEREVDGRAASQVKVRQQQVRKVAGRVDEEDSFKAQARGALPAEKVEAAGGGERAGGTQAVQALAAFHDSIFGSRGWGKLDWQLQAHGSAGAPAHTLAPHTGSGEHTTAEEVATLATVAGVLALMTMVLVFTRELRERR